VRLELGRSQCHVSHYRLPIPRYGRHRLAFARPAGVVIPVGFDSAPETLEFLNARRGIRRIHDIRLSQLHESGRQFVLDAAGRRVYGVWILDDEPAADAPLLVNR
jgi:hypothetical protein